MLYAETLTLNFGAPHLEIHEPSKVDAGGSEKLRKLYARQRVIVKGDWSLFVHNCNWAVFEIGLMIGDCTSNESAQRAASFLDGQKLQSVEFRQHDCSTILQFDLGARLETKPFDEAGEQWNLFSPADQILTLRSNGQFSIQSPSASPEIIWQPMWST